MKQLYFFTRELQVTDIHIQIQDGKWHAHGYNLITWPTGGQQRLRTDYYEGDTPYEALDKLMKQLTEKG